MNKEQKDELIEILTNTEAEDLECVAIARICPDNEPSVVITGSEESAAFILATIRACVESQPGATIH